ncbi:MAG TPA: tetraacyldisaccharide 4'-kinase [Nitrospirales bacterium]|nr:tetraacyldisaccharide 4'-kinase [Nitrospirales bacterium]
MDDRTPAGWLLAPLIPLSHLYGLAMQWRAALYAQGLLRQQALPCRVISVGNLTIGGTGKTPVVIALAAALRDRGRKVGVISRGYKRRSGTSILEISDGRTLRGHPGDSGDEPFLIAQRCPGVPVAVGVDRPLVGRYLLDGFGVDTLVLDDGFQHLALRRDMDILVLDACAPFGNGYLLPRGRLREPLSAMERASVVLVTRASQAQRLDELKATVRAVAPGVPIWITDFAPCAVVQVGGSASVEPSALKGERMLAVSGIGNPVSFRRLLATAGATVVDHCVFGDHHAYSQDDLGRIRRSAEQAGVDRIVTTEKDAVKLAQLDGVAQQEVAIWAVRIDLQWIEGREEWIRVVING